jgi:hypothetical protein
MVRLVALLLLTAVSASCNILSNLGKSGTGVGGVTPPTVTVASAHLTRSPNNEQMARYLCPRYAPSYLCAMVGGVPSASEMRFTFDVQLDISNPNNIPLPVVEVLASFKAFPQQNAQNLGALCLSLCEDPATCPQESQTACTGGGPEIRTMEDFAIASAGFLMNVLDGSARLDNLRVRMVAASGTTPVNIKLELSPDQILAVVGQLGTDAIAQVKQGKVPHFSIPYLVEGSVFLTVENFGKIATNYGPFSGTWNI